MPQARGITLQTVEDVMRAQPWDVGQVENGTTVREAITAAAKAVLRAVPPGRFRDRAIDALVDAQMHANAAISFRGRF